MAELNLPITCGKLECQIASSGICIEGHTPTESCPFYGVLESLDNGEYDDIAELEDISDPELPESNRSKLGSGEPLTPEDVDRFLMRRPATFVTIIGERNSGKTTLICAIYSLFLRNSGNPFEFVHSKTLIGFEKRCHHSRLASGRAIPDTPRTSISDGLNFFHIAIVNKTNQHKRIDLMISDRAGEVYQAARINTTKITELIEVNKANFIVILLDGERLADPLKRSNAMQAVRQTIHSFTDAQALTQESYVQVILTKTDLLENIPNKTEFEKQFDFFQTKLLDDFGSRLKKLEFLKISARALDNEVKQGQGVLELLSTWCNPVSHKSNATFHNIELTTEFDKLLNRTQMDGSI